MSTLPCLSSFLSCKSISHSNSFFQVTISSFHVNSHFFWTFKCLSFSSRHYYVISFNSCIIILNAVILELRMLKLRFSAFSGGHTASKGLVSNISALDSSLALFYCITLSSSPPATSLASVQICITSLCSWKPFKTDPLGLSHYLPELAYIVCWVCKHSQLSYASIIHSFIHSMCQPLSQARVERDRHCLCLKRDCSPQWQILKLKSRELNEFPYTMC